MRKTLHIEIGAGYDVIVGSHLLAEVGERVKALGNYRVAAVVTDDNVRALYAEGVAASLAAVGITAKICVVPHGEGSKSFSRLEKVLDFFADIELTRTDVVVYVGGGVVGDLAGFAAAAYLRGVDYVAVPTTLLAMLDSSVGGKTGVNLGAGKNLAGAFWQPRAVYVDVSTLATLDNQNFCCGIGEAIKYAMIRDISMLDELNGARDEETLTKLILKGLAVKKYCVETDTRDVGVRQILNFGHTLGHVVEKESGYAVPHGIAVGLGMVLITRYSERLGWTSAGTADEIARVLRLYSMPAEYGEDAETLLLSAKNDKKRKGNRLTLVVLKKAGECYLQDAEVRA